MDSGQLMRLVSKNVQKFSAGAPAMYAAGYMNFNMRMEEKAAERSRDRIITSVRDTMAKIPVLAQKAKLLPAKPYRVGDYIPLVCKRDMKIIQDGEDILHFDMPGSGYLSFPLMHKGRTGEPEYTLPKMVAESILQGMQHTVVPEAFQLGLADKNAALLIGSAVAKALADMGIEKIRRAEKRDIAGMNAFGTKVKLPNGKILEYARRSIDRFRTKYTIAGPSALNIMGDYTTRMSRGYMLALAADYLGGKFKEAGNSKTLARPVCIRIKGHSRGGVTSSEGAMMIRRWIMDKYPQFLDSVRFEITQFDPVPGSDTRYSVAREVDYRTQGRDGNGRFESDGIAYAALGNSAQTTVVYSMHTQYPMFFTPQIVKGADRIIVTPYNHSVGLRNIDKNRVSDRAEEPTQEGHRQAFIDTETQTAYSMGSLNDLRRGVYILDEDNRMTRMNGYSDFASVMDEIYKETWFQGARHKAIMEAARDWFRREDGTGN